MDNKAVTLIFRNETILLCEMCSESSENSFTADEDCLKEITYSKTKFDCHGCKKVINSFDKSNLSSVVPKSENILEPFHLIFKICKICQRELKDKMSFMKHMMMHKYKGEKEDKTKDKNVENEKEDLLKCNMCSKEFSKFATIRQVKHHMEKCEASFQKKLETISKYPKCDQCEFRYSGMKKLKLHIKEEHKVKKERVLWKCDECDYSNNHKTRFSHHKRIKHDKVKLKCEQCEYSAYHKNAIIEHTKVVHEINETEKCDICGKQFILKRRLIVHKRMVHDSTHGGSNFDCSRCDHKTVTRAGIISHMQVHHDKVKQKCDQCEYKCKYLTSLKRHIKTIHEGVRFECSVCNVKYTEMVQLKIHIESVHENKKYSCGYNCGYEGSRKVHLKRHIRTEHEKLTYECQQCDFTSKDKNGIKLHEGGMHSGNTFQCDQCEYKTNWSRRLKDHTESVHNEETYDCDQCNYKGPLPKSLKTHKRNIHTNAIYSCSKCKFQTKVNAFLLRHTRSIHSDLVIKCPKCDYKSKDESAVKRHVKFRHIHKAKVLKQNYCKICQKSYLNTPYFKQHIKFVHSTERLDCRHCNFNTKYPDLLRKHTKIQHINTTTVEHSPKEEPIDKQSSLSENAVEYHLKKGDM